MTTKRVDIIDGSVEKAHIWLNERWLSSGPKTGY